LNDDLALKRGVVSIFKVRSARSRERNSIRLNFSVLPVSLTGLEGKVSVPIVVEMI